MSVSFSSIINPILDSKDFEELSKNLTRALEEQSRGLTMNRRINLENNKPGSYSYKAHIYNIYEKPDAPKGSYFMEFAMMGYSREDVQVELSEEVLSITASKPKSMDDRKYIWTSVIPLVPPSFTQKVTVENGVKVLGAKLENGVLTIHLQRPVPETPKSTPIPLD